MSQEKEKESEWMNEKERQRRGNENKEKGRKWNRTEVWGIERGKKLEKLHVNNSSEERKESEREILKGRKKENVDKIWIK